MTFSYTDDAIVSTSPTGRHLSTVIRRPVVLMSGWNEHAEEICKVLNDCKPADSIADLIDRGYLTDYRSVLGPRVVLDFGHPSKTITEQHQEQKAEALLAAGKPTEARTLKAWQDYGHTIYAHAVEQGKVRDTLAERVTELSAEVEALRKPVEVSGNTARDLCYSQPGDSFYAIGNPHTFKRV